MARDQNSAARNDEGRAKNSARDSQAALFSDQPSTADRICTQVRLGTDLYEFVIAQPVLPFAAWVSEFRRRWAECRGENMSEEQLTWLWDALVTEPELKARWEARKSEYNLILRNHPILPAGSIVGIYPFHRLDPKKRADQYPEPEVFARLDDSLFCWHRTNFEFAPVPVTVVVKQGALGREIRSVTEEAKAFHVNASHIRVYRDSVAFRHKSLNKVASCILQASEKTPKRRRAQDLAEDSKPNKSRNVKDHGVWMAGQKSVPLSFIKREFEWARWTCPNLDDWPNHAARAPSFPVIEVPLDEAGPDDEGDA